MITFFLAVAANILLLVLAIAVLLEMPLLKDGFEIGVMVVWIVTPILTLWVLLRPSLFWKRWTLRNQRLLLEEEQRMHQARQRDSGKTKPVEPE